jgi:Matrixin
MRSLLLFLPLLALGCRDTKGASDCGVPSAGHSEANYVFVDSNFSCEEEGAILTPFDLDADSFFDGATLAQADVVTDFELIATDWSSTGAELVVNVGDTDLPTGVRANDGDHHVFMVDDNDGIDDGTNSIALTSRWGGEDGETDDCDIRFFTTRDDSSVRSWVADDTPGSSQYDLAYILGHEMGHCVGLGDQEAPELSGSLMFGSYTQGTNYSGPHVDDEEGAILIYGS